MTTISHSRPTLGTEEKKACCEVLDSGQIAQGKKVEEFEEKFRGLTGRRYAVAVSSGTIGLSLSLLALPVSEGDEVIVPSFTCAALLHALDIVKARPVVADIDLEDFNISVPEIKKKINRKTKAVIVPHMFGRAARMPEILKLGIPVLEDGTQALGASIGKKPVGSFGEASIFSFYATKMITTGEGGMVVTDSKRLAQQLLDLRDYDKKEIYRFRMNAKMTDLQAAIGVEQLKKLPFFIQRRREIARLYNEALRKTEFILPSEDQARNHVYFRYVLRISGNSTALLKQLQKQGIDAKSPVFKPLHRYVNSSDKLFQSTVQAFKETCSLPIFPLMKDEECQQICRTLSGQTAWRPSKKSLALSHA